jgi:hypothetical protein
VTFLELQNAVARLLGVNSVDHLGPEGDDVRAWVNTAYRACYAPSDGSLPTWARRRVGVYFPAPLPLTFAATQGQTTMGGLAEAAIPVGYKGSRILIGDTFYEYAGYSSGHSMVQPWVGATGSVTGTLYFSHAQLPANVTFVAANPETLRGGILLPLGGRSGEQMLRSLWSTGDFFTLSGRPSVGLQLPQPTGRIEVGDPSFYFVDSNTTPFSLAVYPVPSAALSVTVTAGILPARMTSNGEVPQIPADMVDDVLLPIARYLAASESKRFSGQNIQGLKAAHDAALVRLRVVGTPQHDTGSTLRPGY